MTQLLAVDGPLYRVLSGWVAFVRAGVLWLVFSLPIVTAPSSTVVLLHSLHNMTAGKAAPTVAESWRLVRHNFWPALRLGAVQVLGYGVAVSAILGPSPGGIWDTVLPMVTIPVAITWVLVSQWSFAVLEERSDGATAALQYAYLRAIRRPDLAAAGALGSFVLVAVGLVLPATVWLPYWLTVPALWALLTTLTSRRAGVTARAG